jgi:hypothetical protein
MIKVDEAQIIAQRYLGDLQVEIGVPLTIVKIREESFGWVYFYQSSEYMETENFSSMLAGNAPFIIDRERPGVHVLGTAHPTDFYVQEYVMQRGNKSACVQL